MFNFPNLLLSSSTWSTSSCETKGTFRIALCRATGPRVLCQDICQWKNSLIVLKDGVVLPEWPLQTEISVSATFRVYLFHIETVELNTSTYGWIKLNSDCFRLFCACHWDVPFIYSLKFFTTQKSLSSVYSQNSRHRRGQRISQIYNLHEVSEK